MEIKTLYTIHALLQVIAFLVLFPLGIIIALTKNYIGPSWFILHIIFQSLGVFCVFAAIAFMAYAQYLKNKNKTNTTTKEPNSNTPDTNQQLPAHVIIGIIIVCLIILQLIWAVFLRHTINRDIWVLIHIILAVLILSLGWTNLYLGYKLYNS